MRMYKPSNKKLSRSGEVQAEMDSQQKSTRLLKTIYSLLKPLKIQNHNEYSQTPSIKSVSL